MEIAKLRQHGLAFITLIVVFAWMPAIRAGESLHAVKPAQATPQVRDYGFLWWADGWRGRSKNGGKVICVRTGHYGLALDVQRLRLLISARFLRQPRLKWLSPKTTPP